MKTLHITVREKIATYMTRDGEIVCGNGDYRIEFDFDSEWDAYSEKIARFIWNGAYFDQKFTGNICTVPVIDNTTECLVGVHAGQLSTTTPAKIVCLKSILCGTPIPGVENDKVYANEAKEAADRAEEAAEHAEEVAKNFDIGVYVENDPTVPAWAKQPTKPTYTADEVGARPADWTPTETDPTVPAWAKKPNPPTASEVGAAPAGLFSGAYSVSASATDADIDTMLTSALSVMGNSEIKYISFTNSASSTSLPNGYWTMKIDKFTPTMAIVEATNKYTSTYAKLVRAYSNGSWQSWEWVNPPMKPGVEYRTTERVNGKPVYYKMVDCGAYPDNAVKEVAHGASNIQFIYVADATTYTGDTISLLPDVSIWANPTNVKVRTTQNLSVYKLWVTIKYTKTT